MMDVDGSTGEGGGQVVRTAVALAAATNTDVRIDRIRAGRETPGLRPQHVAAVEAVGTMCDADIEGVEVGSRKLFFRPRAVEGGRYSVDVGTAGSTSLVAQAVVLAAVTSDADVEFTVTGGTDVRWSPPHDYLEHVTVPLLRHSGVEVDVEIRRRGYYPEGGGEIEVDVEGMEPTEVDLRRRGEHRSTTLYIHASNLSSDVVNRMAESARRRLEREDVEDVDVETETSESLSTGAGVVAVAEFERSRLGASALGEPGRPAEDVGRAAAERLLTETDADGAVDRYAADQIAPYLAFAGGSYTTTEVTGHLKTNVELCERFLGDPKIDGAEVTASKGWLG
ncbi:MAG: RNA 3'-terminal phosphate cyclase [Halobacteriota archaeon]